ncbi:MAG: oligopeptide ABC transporter ATP-binding protein [Azospirillum brasilense]|uniref:Oligopeptide ABC transporter ATP-binding protein n=1 Tax=Roseomonas gilardii TaxID=257708 RepID=A0A1L7ALW5_9PROT|nr:oligopeptide/dipeptide ABC transporter ATP-binding protein [Roseomonas gilardii]APT59753.1 oligopeptide ABC transporter ATP-binding protein [Roseomonas gilardii]PZR13364.1 MAG: oligopeptide ABC transporter ATP-binding protein [Azospirillum brasilense]
MNASPLADSSVHRKPIVEAWGLSKHYPTSRSLRQALRGQRPMLRAVDGVDLTLRPGESVGLVGESGSGKTTIGRLLLKLTEPSAGQLAFEGQDLARLDRRGMRLFRQRAQLVFQNPFDALNPRFSIGRTIAEPLLNTGVPKAEHAARVAESLRTVHLGDPARLLDRMPHQLSGGQLQRVVLARALVLHPRFLVADEPVSMLDVSVRAGILNLLRELRDRLGLTTLAISHDLTLVRYVCERTLVMYLGKVVEDGPTARVIASPAHPYTTALIRAVPRPQVAQPRDALPLHGTLGDAVEPGGGCRLRHRCPHAFARCAAEEPPLTEIAPGHRAACHLHAA